MNVHFLFISGPEIIVVLLIVVMFFGADKIPEIARGLGKGIRQVKDATNDIKKEINESADVEKLGVDNINITKDLKKEVTDVKNTLDDLTGPIKRQL